VDPVTHGVVGTLLAETGLRQRYGRQATLALAGGAWAPDLDVFWSWGRGVAALETHRGFTHSLLGGALLTLGLAALVRPLGPERRWAPLAGLAALGVFAGHLFLDLITSFGIQLFLPFSRARPAWDWLFIIDLGFTVPLVAALVAARLTGHPWLARAGCAYLVAYLGVAATAHATALAETRQAAARADLPVRHFAALPQPPSPRHWLGVAETADGYAIGRVDVLRPGRLVLDRIPRGPDSVALRDTVSRVGELPPVRTYLWFARFPVVGVRESGDQRVVEFRDLRFTNVGWRDDPVVRRIAPLFFRDRLDREPFVLQVVLAASGSVHEVTLR
jgi:inner membrane protein